MEYVIRKGTRTPINAPTEGQVYIRRHSQQNCSSKMTQRHGRAFLLASQSGEPKTLQKYWSPGSQNIGDYHIKHHQATHHRAVCDIYLHKKAKKGQYQGIQICCVDLEGPQTARVAA